MGTTVSFIPSHSFPRNDQDKLITKIHHALFRGYDTGHAIYWEKPKEYYLDIIEFKSHTN
jgi:hypothetical protein